jgi:creatinine amidohydrolase
MTRRIIGFDIARSVADAPKGFTTGRRTWEAVLRRAYAGDWPALLWGMVPGSSNVQIIRHEIRDSRITGTTRIAFASDLHVGPTTTQAVLGKAAQLIRQAAPDVLLLGGDYVFLEATSSRLDRLRAWVESTGVDEVLAVMGNHDLWTRHEQIRGTLQAAGTRVLCNEQVELPGPVVLLALDDPWAGDCRVPPALPPTSAYRIVLCHAPDGLLHCAEEDFDLISVRTHPRRASCAPLGTAGHVAWSPLPRPPPRVSNPPRTPGFRIKRDRRRRYPDPPLRSTGHSATRPHPGPMILANANWKTIRDRSFEIAILPWGATEAHNYHLPYATDNFQAQRIAEESAARAAREGASVIVLPAIPFGVNTQQLDIPLTINMNPSTQMAVLGDIVESLEDDVAKLVLLNGHGGNNFRQAVRELQLTTSLFICVVDWFRTVPVEQFFEDLGDHAGEAETSLMMHLEPELVRPLEEAGDGHANPWRIGAFRDGTAWAPRQWTRVTADTGVGNPAKATAQKGADYFDAVCGVVSDFLVELSATPPDEMYRSSAG